MIQTLYKSRTGLSLVRVSGEEASQILGERDEQELFFEKCRFYGDGGARSSWNGLLSCVHYSSWKQINLFLIRQQQFQFQIASTK